MNPNLFLTTDLSLESDKGELDGSPINGDYTTSDTLSIKDQIARGEKLWLINPIESEKIVLNVY